MKAIITISLILFCFTLFAQNTIRQPSDDRKPPELISKKTNRPLTTKRLPATKLKLVNKKDNTKSIDFGIEHIDCGKLEIVFEYMNFNEKQLKVTVMNKGVLESKQAYLAISVGAYTSGLMELHQKPTTMYSSGQVVQPLKQNESRDYVFDITEAYNIIWATSLSQKVRDPYGYAILVTEPIVIK